MKIRITREVNLPDGVRLERFRRMPELGPRVLFFSGGSALYHVSRKLVKYTHNSIHVVTPFDSGGSSAKLREAFDMPAIGDIRHRLMALADQSFHGNPEIFDLFAYRLPKKLSQSELKRALDRLASGKHPLVRKIPNPMRKIIRNHLRKFQMHVSDDFDYRGASVGNLVLSAGYLDARRHMDPVIFLFSKLVEVRGIVRPVVNRSYHLAAKLEDGTGLVGQHKFTGKEQGRIRSKIVALYLVDRKNNPVPVEVTIRQKIANLIGSAEAICYPMGSFYSSILATLLPKGIGTAIASNRCPKIFIPNTGDDPECIGTPLEEQVDRLIETVRRDVDGGAPVSDVLNFIILDEDRKRYKGRFRVRALEKSGIRVVRCPLVSEKTAPYIDGDRLIPVLLSFC